MSDDYQIKPGTFVFPEIAAFIGSIFFTALLLVYQNKDKYSSYISIFNFTLPIKQYVVICLPLSATTIIFLFSSIFLGLLGISESKNLEKEDKFANKLFGLGVLTMFVSVTIVLILIDVIISVFGILLMFYIWNEWKKVRAKPDN